jgi:hypothetical protein
MFQPHSSDDSCYTAIATGELQVKQSGKTIRIQTCERLVNGFRLGFARAYQDVSRGNTAEVVNICRLDRLRQPNVSKSPKKERKIPCKVVNLE